MSIVAIASSAALGTPDAQTRPQVFFAEPEAPRLGESNLRTQLRIGVSASLDAELLLEREAQHHHGPQ
jgi:hypothetical protein